MSESHPADWGLDQYLEHLEAEHGWFQDEEGRWSTLEERGGLMPGERTPPENPADDIGAAAEAVEVAATATVEAAQATGDEETIERAETMYEQTMRALADWAEDVEEQAEEVEAVADAVAEEAAEEAAEAAEEGDHTGTAADAKVTEVAAESAELAELGGAVAKVSAEEAEVKADTPPEATHWFYRPLFRKRSA